MKFFFALILMMVGLLGLANEPDLKDAPMEWLIVQTLQSKSLPDNHLDENDELVKEIFDNVFYDEINDELIVVESQKSLELKTKLLDYLKSQQFVDEHEIDPMYEAWKKEKKAPYQVRLKKTKLELEGFYFVNHVHTNISQDNSSLKWLKISPAKTFSYVEKFVGKRDTSGVLALCDHDTDIAFDKIASQTNHRLQAVRSIEWGGSTHMGLIDIKENWELLAKGRQYKKEESIIKSRSSEGFRIVNHPNRKSPAFPYTSWLDADGVEVWNTLVENSPFLIFKIRRSNNRKAFQQWQDALKVGNKHTAVAGSDFHFIIPCLRDRSLHFPINYIPSGEKKQVKEILKEGNVSILTRPDSPRINLQAKLNAQTEWKGMGEVVNGSGELAIRLTADFSHVNKRLGGFCYSVINSFSKLLTFWKKRSWEIRFYNQKDELLAKEKLNPKKFKPGKDFVATLSLPAAGKDLIRAELWSINKKKKQIDLIAATNPVFINW